MEARQAKAAKSQAKKAASQAKAQTRVADANALGSQVVAAFVHAHQIDKLLVPQLRAALQFWGVAPQGKRDALRKLLQETLQLPSARTAPPLVISNSSAAATSATPSEASARRGIT
mmetsp:Transcript_39982/g.80115  ORF Transcript_39982/g.80115 Transcript_39982/m.80115 type:complete len:116 (-) Transcript_39982:151-498(-)